MPARSLPGKARPVTAPRARQSRQRLRARELPHRGQIVELQLMALMAETRQTTVGAYAWCGSNCIATLPSSNERSRLTSSYATTALMHAICSYPCAPCAGHGRRGCGLSWDGCVRTLAERVSTVGVRKDQVGGRCFVVIIRAVVFIWEAMVAAVAAQSENLKVGLLVCLAPPKEAGIGQVAPSSARREGLGIEIRRLRKREL